MIGSAAWILLPGGCAALDFHHLDIPIRSRDNFRTRKGIFADSAQAVAEWVLKSGGLVLVAKGFLVGKAVLVFCGSFAGELCPGAFVETGGVWTVVFTGWLPHAAREIDIKTAMAKKRGLDGFFLVFIIFSFINLAAFSSGMASCCSPEKTRLVHRQADHPAPVTSAMASVSPTAG